MGRTRTPCGASHSPTDRRRRPVPRADRCPWHSPPEDDAAGSERFDNGVAGPRGSAAAADRPYASRTGRTWAMTDQMTPDQSSTDTDSGSRRVLLRSFGAPNSTLHEFDFWDSRYEGRRLFSE